MILNASGGSRRYAGREVSDLREKYLNFGRVLVNTFERDCHDCFSVAVTTVAVHRSIAHSIVTRLGYGWL